MKKILPTLVFSILTNCGFSQEIDILRVPWGVAAHPHRAEELANIDKSFGLVEDADIRWMREDFSFAYICKDPATMNFERYDDLIAKTEEYGIMFLPVLQGFDNEIQGSRPDVTPLYEHLDAWRDYVRATVTRYKDKLKYWEIWNEEDGGFWRPHPDANQYVPLLQAAYEEIKAIDPELQVVVGGLTGWNTEYLKAMYEAGAKDYFDIIAVHPYNEGPDRSLRAKRVMGEFKQVMANYGDGDIPIWITEFGTTSFQSPLMNQQPDFMLKAIGYGLKKLGKTPPANLKDLKVGIAVSPRITDLDEVERSRNWLPGISEDSIVAIPFTELQALDPDEYPVLIGAEGTTIDEPLLEPLLGYVKKGGLLLAVNKLPFYYVRYLDENGIWQTKERHNITYPMFRMKFEAFWTGDYPYNSSSVKTSEDALNEGLPAVDNVYLTRYLSGEGMEEGDTYYPIITALRSDGNRVAEGMSLYTYGDWQGGVLMSTAAVDAGYTWEEQANLLQRVYLTYLSLGVEKMFWYDLHNDGYSPYEREHNFGLLGWNWNPKPAYHAYKELTEALGQNPTFEERRNMGDPDIWALVFDRAEDNKKVLAIWAVDVTATVTFCGQEIPLTDNKVHFVYLNKNGRPLINTLESPVYIDFGKINMQSPFPWNNMNENSRLTGSKIPNLIDSIGGETRISLEVVEGFTGISSGGLTETETGFEQAATADFFYSGTDMESACLLLKGLDTEQDLDFSFYGGSTLTIGDRYTRYKVTGSNEGEGILNAALNTSEVVEIYKIRPDSLGTIRIEISKPAGNTDSGYYILNLMTIAPSCTGADSGSNTDIMTTTDAKSGKTLILFPNPVHDTLYINSTESLEEIVIVDYFGRTVTRYSGKQAKRKFISLVSLRKGYYLVKFTDKNGNVHTKKVIKE
ncbi:T9SS C-terminal target domain-containing protein [Sinomicrobium pectinilyticum]|uniref:T9SS C-terminal target domain-containing protein n=1 Tax=Sinomicrobium pectinilyticum TaxID=1084421 RepID=A0A3N0E3W8_SINP1|nr:T9SS type A sorting domain-containing protein [Sinomicrobium pectinilyticum]RNL82493.1 T9SS C-terminal target domain-containing protein [Sinomicrobium pectinilyticum]